MWLHVVTHAIYGRAFPLAVSTTESYMVFGTECITRPHRRRARGFMLRSRTTQHGHEEMDNSLRIPLSPSLSAGCEAQFTLAFDAFNAFLVVGGEGGSPHTASREMRALVLAQNRDVLGLSGTLARFQTDWTKGHERVSIRLTARKDTLGSA